MLRDIQEVLADKEFKVGAFYHHKGSLPAAANRLQGVANQFPLYSQADESLWLLADSYQRLGDKWEQQQADALTRIVKDYPLSAHVNESKTRLEAMKRPVPEADPVAYSRMKYELDNRGKRSLLGKVWGPFAQHPDVSTAAKAGTPQMTGFRPSIPASVPALAAGAQGTSDVTAAVVTDPNALNTNPDARTAAGQPGPAGAAPAAGAPPAGSVSRQAPATQPIAITKTGVDLNSAPESEIAKLPGINKVMAKRIVAMRPFLSVNDLIKTGLSKKTIDKLKPASGPETPKSTAKSTTK
jgi:outer membrane protein assembly factor BamD